MYVTFDQDCTTMTTETYIHIRSGHMKYTYNKFCNSTIKTCYHHWIWFSWIFPVSNEESRFSWITEFVIYILSPFIWKVFLERFLSTRQYFLKLKTLHTCTHVISDTVSTESCMVWLTEKYLSFQLPLNWRHYFFILPILKGKYSCHTHVCRRYLPLRMEEISNDILLFYTMSLITDRLPRKRPVNLLHWFFIHQVNRHQWHHCQITAVIYWEGGILFENQQSDGLHYAKRSMSYPSILPLVRHRLLWVRSNPVCPTQFLGKRTQILCVQLNFCGNDWASMASVSVIPKEGWTGFILLWVWQRLRTLGTFSYNAAQIEPGASQARWNWVYLICPDVDGFYKVMKVLVLSVINHWK